MMLASAGHILFHYRNFLFPILFALVFLPGPRLFEDMLYAVGLGAGIALVGEIVRVLTIGLKYIIRGGRNRRVYAEDLVTEGLYAHTRNPMYVGNVLIACGFAVASNSWACVLIAIPLFMFFYAAIVAAEEQFLRNKFGAAFDRYTHDVPRWLVRFGGIRETLASMEFHWSRVIVKEYGTLFGWVSGMCLIAIVQMSRQDHYDPDARAALIAVLAAAVIFWIAARWIKKRGILVAD